VYQILVVDPNSLTVGINHQTIVWTVELHLVVIVCQ